MSTGSWRLERTPFIRLVERAHRALAADMVRSAEAHGFKQARGAHNAVFANLPMEGARITDLASRAGITKQSMGEVVRELEGFGIVELGPDPTDGRAKVVSYTDLGRVIATGGRAHLKDMEELFSSELGSEAYESARALLDRVISLVGPDQTS